MSITRKILIALIVIILVLGLIGFALSRGDTADLSVDDVAGVEPTLEEADAETIPTVAIAEPVGWDEGLRNPMREALPLGSLISY